MARALEGLPSCKGTRELSANTWCPCPPKLNPTPALAPAETRETVHVSCFMSLSQKGTAPTPHEGRRALPPRTWTLPDRRGRLGSLQRSGGGGDTFSPPSSLSFPWSPGDSGRTQCSFLRYWFLYGPRTPMWTRCTGPPDVTVFRHRCYVRDLHTQASHAFHRCRPPFCHCRGPLVTTEPGTYFI